MIYRRSGILAFEPIWGYDVTRKIAHSAAFGITLALFLACGSLHAETNGSMKKVENIEQSPSSGAEKNSGRKISSISFTKLISSIEEFNKDNHLRISGEAFSSNIPIIERIYLGFQQDPPRSLKLEDGTHILWGWQHGQPWFQSVAIFDGDNKPRIFGIADNIPRIYSWRSKTGLKSISDYYKLLEDRRSRFLGTPAVTLFAESQEDIDRYYRFAARWLEANLVGFNSQCGSPAYAASCALAEEVKIPIVIRSSKCISAEGRDPSCTLRVPEKTRSEVPLDMFKQ